MSHHTRNLMLGLAALPMSLGNCGPIKNCAGQIVNILGQVIKPVLDAGTPSPTPDNPAPVQKMDCTFLAEPADPSGRAPYSVSGLAILNGWEWYQACPVSAKALGFVIPAKKITGDPNTSDMIPQLVFVIDTAPVLGRGSGHYEDPFRAGDMALWRKAYVVGTGR